MKHAHPALDAHRHSDRLLRVCPILAAAVPALTH